MLAHSRQPESAWRVEIPASPPVGELVQGMKVEEAAEFLPRVFNLCRHAQSTAIRLALGLKPHEGTDLNGEIRREHLLRFAVFLPAKLDLPAFSLPQYEGAELAQALFGIARFPETPDGFEAFLDRDLAVANVLREIRTRFAMGEACADLPFVTEATALDKSPLENSVAARHADHPVMRALEQQYGRGPLWRVTARAIDIQATLDGTLPRPKLLDDGTAIVPAARGAYAIRAEVEGGRVTSIHRVTPTDHMIAANGVLAQSLETLPAEKHALADLVVEFLDPCVPLKVVGHHHA